MFEIHEIKACGENEYQVDVVGSSFDDASSSEARAAAHEVAIKAGLPGCAYSGISECFLSDKNNVPIPDEEVIERIRGGEKDFRYHAIHRFIRPL